jgi:hypothetical protein
LKNFCVVLFILWFAGPACKGKGGGGHSMGGDVRGRLSGSAGTKWAPADRATRVLVMLDTGKADIFPTLSIAADLLQRHAGHISTTPDATIAYFDPMTLGPLTRIRSDETRGLHASSPSMRSR